MRTLDEATELPGVRKYRHGLNIHFNPIPNWYVYRSIRCPVCDNLLRWDYVGEIPGITTPETTKHLKIKSDGGRVVAWVHRQILIECSDCNTSLWIENYDTPLAGEDE